MSNLLNFPLVILAGVILLPLIPAFILFKLLPSSAVMKGPLQGFRIDLSGAFAGYFALVIAILSTKNSVWDPVFPPYQVWTVTGTITDNNGSLIAPLGSEDISLLPPSLSESNSWFTIDIPVKPGQGGATAYPTLAISHPGYEPVYIDLDPNSIPPSGVTFDTTSRSVHIDNMHLQPLGPYSPAAPLNAQAAAPADAAQIRPTGVRK